MNDGISRTTAGLDDVLITAELAARPSRAPDYEGEAKALAALAELMAASPETVLQKLVDTALALCRAESAGISTLEPGGENGVFRWRVVAGVFAPNLGGTMPRAASPCGTVIDRDAMLLFAHPERHFPYAVAIDPPLAEALLVPFHAAGEPVGTVWVIAHTPGKKFDAEDARLLQSLSRFAAVAHQMTSALRTEAAARAVLEAGARELSSANGALRESEQRLRRAMSIETVEERISQLVALMPAGVYTCDADGRLTFYNRRAAELWGREPRLGEGQERFCGSFRMWTPDGVLLTHGECPMAHAVQEGRAARNLEVVIEQPTGSRLVASVNIDPLLDREGQLAGAINVFVDITDRKRAEQALREREAWLRGQREALEAALNGAPLEASLGVLVKTATDGLGVDTRAAFYLANAEGTSLRHVVGMGAAYAEAVDGFKIGADSLACGLATHTGQPVLTTDVTEDPRWEPWRWMAERFDYRGCWSFPIRTSAGTFVGTLAAYSRQPRAATERDLELAALLTQTGAIIISRHQEAEERRQAQEALRESEGRLRLALAAARMGTWSWEVAADRHRRDANLNQLLGLEPVETVLPIEEFFEHIHPDDRAAVRGAFDATVRRGHNLQAEFRVVWPGGEVRWLRDQGDVFGGPAGSHLAGACLDITERKLLEEALREADRRKDEFLAMLGHELRNPLAPLRGVMETLQRQQLEGPALGRAHAMMERQVGHLGRLVDDLLDVSRITRGLVELRREPVNLDEVASQAAEMAAPAIEGRGHDLSLTLPRKPLRVEGDATRLTQVIFNLLNNAAKYTEPGGKIWLSVERESDQAVVRVRDNGSGMRAELVPKVFDLFTQGQRTPDRSQGGLGLGLTLVKRLVEKHDGSVGARSDGPGKGSEFTVRLPALPPEAEKPPPARAPGPPQAEAQVGRALVVDDNFDVAESLTWMLEGLAREVKMVHSGQAALDLVGQWWPDVIISDIGMPAMDGYETCRRLRQLPGMERVVIAAVSGYGGPEDRRRSQEAGFDRHLVKPIGRATLEELVKSAAGA